MPEGQQESTYRKQIKIDPAVLPQRPAICDIFKMKTDQNGTCYRQVWTRPDAYTEKTLDEAIHAAFSECPEANPAC